MKLRLSNDEFIVLSEIVKHIKDICECKDGVFIPNYENLMLRFPEYDFEVLKKLCEKL